MQRKSYERFLQMNLLPEEREEHGLQSVFTEHLSVLADFRETCSLEFVEYSIGELAVQVRRAQGSRVSAS